MSKLIKAVLAIVVILGLLYVLQSRVGEQVPVRVEKPVDPSALR
jgi:hypothetical protein